MMHGWVVGVCVWVDECMYVYMDGCMYRWIGRWVYEWIGVYKDWYRWVGVWMGVCMYGWVYG